MAIRYQKFIIACNIIFCFKFFTKMRKYIQHSKPSQNPESVATYAVGRLGDLLVSTPILRAIHLLYPSANHTLIGNAVWKQILLSSEWPQINLFLEADSTKFRHLTLYKPNLQTNTWEKVGTIPSMTGFLKNYKMGISLRYRSLRFAIEMMRARIKYRVGSHNKWWARFFYSHFYQATNTPIHVRDTHLNVLTSIDKNFVKQQKEYWNEHQLPELKKQFDLQKFKEEFGQHFILVNPTSSMREKTWEAKNFQAIVKILKEKNKNLVVLGAPHETDWLREVAGNYAPIYQPNSIFDTCDLIAAADLLITNTSSLQFIAASTGTRTITLMGIAHPKVWGPLGKNDIVIKAPPLANEAIQKNSSIPRLEQHKIIEKHAYGRITIEAVLDVLHKLSILK